MKKYILIDINERHHVRNIYKTEYLVYTVFDLISNENYLIKISKSSGTFQGFIRNKNENAIILLSISPHSFYAPLKMMLYYNIRIITGKRFENTKEKFPEYFI